MPQTGSKKRVSRQPDSEDDDEDFYKAIQEDQEMHPPTTAVPPPQVSVQQLAERQARSARLRTRLSEWKCERLGLVNRGWKVHEVVEVVDSDVQVENGKGERQVVDMSGVDESEDDEDAVEVIEPRSPLKIAPVNRSVARTRGGGGKGPPSPIQKENYNTMGKVPPPSDVDSSSEYECSKDDSSSSTETEGEEETVSRKRKRAAQGTSQGSVPKQDRRASLTASYNEKLSSRLLPGLHKSISLAKRSYPAPSPSHKPGPALPPPHGVSSPLTEEHVAARTNLQDLLIEYGTMVSEAEWGGSKEGRRVLFVQGFPVNEEDGGFVLPLLDSEGNVLAKSMRVGESMRLLLEEPSDRIDMCLIAGHHARWSNGRKPTDADKSCMRKVMRLAPQCGYDVMVVMGGEGTTIARQCCMEGQWDYQLRGIKLGWGKDERVMEVRPRGGGSSDVSDQCTLVMTTYHPQGGLPDGQAGVEAAIGTAQIFDQQVSAIRTYLGLPQLDHASPLEAYVKMTAEGLDSNDKLNGGLHSLRLRRDQEKDNRVAVPLASLPGRVRAQLMEDWGVEAEEDWKKIVSSGKWRPRSKDYPKPWSPLCYALSDSGVKGGKERMEQWKKEPATVPGFDSKHKQDASGGADTSQYNQGMELVKKDPQLRAEVEALPVEKRRKKIKSLSQAKNGRNGGRAIPVESERKGRGVGVKAPYVLVQCLNWCGCDEGVRCTCGAKCVWQYHDVTIANTQPCIDSCVSNGEIQPGEPCPNGHVGQVSKKRRLESCKHVKSGAKQPHLFTGAVIGTSSTPWPGVPLYTGGKWEVPGMEQEEEDETEEEEEEEEEIGEGEDMD